MKYNHTRKNSAMALLLSVVVSFVIACGDSDVGSEKEKERSRRPVRSGDTDASAVTSESYQTIDIHTHLEGVVPSGKADFESAADRAAEAMVQFGIGKMIIMPSPRPLGEKSAYSYDLLLPVLGIYPDLFDFFAGGGTLNSMISEAGETSPELIARFQEKAEEIFLAGAIGYGEMGALCLSLRDDQPYCHAAPNHALFLLLADLAAKNNLPVAIHMEAVATDMDLPDNLTSQRNPSHLSANIDQFEELLGHNRNAIILWSHAGWDNTGHRTVGLQDELLAKHPNLYMSIKLSGENGSENSVLDDRGEIRPEWLALFQKYPDRFMIGSDQVYVSSLIKTNNPDSVGTTLAVLSKLPEELAFNIGHENARALFYP